MGRFRYWLPKRMLAFSATTPLLDHRLPKDTNIKLDFYCINTCLGFAKIIANITQAVYKQSLKHYIQGHSSKDYRTYSR